MNLKIVKPELREYITKREYSTQNVTNFIAALYEADWSSVRHSFSDISHPENSYTLFSNILLKIFENNFPLKTIKFINRNTPKKEWMTSGLVKSCKKKSKLYKRQKTQPTSENLERYRKYRNKLKTVLILAEKKYYADKINNYRGDLAKTWKIVNKVLNRGKKGILNTKFVTDMGLSSEPQKIADTFNKFFSTIGENLAKDLPKSHVLSTSFLSGNYMDSFYISPTTEAEIIKVVTEFNNKTSFGYDGIPVNILKLCIKPLSPVISDLINHSFERGYFPKELKIAKVCPIFKSGCKSVISNYRPISVLPSISKIFEKIFQIRLTNYLTSKNILSNNQFGFRERYSPQMALLDLCDKLTKAIDNGKISIAIFLDLQKAFDSLDHEILLLKLNHYGIRGIALDWLTSYLNNREQFVLYRNMKSPREPIKWGIPQGSILGPLLFIIFINDVGNSSNILHFILFADDTNACCTGDTIEEVQDKINLELKKLGIWFSANHLSLNIKKTNFMVFCNKRRFPISMPLKITLGGMELDRVANTKFLGVILDEDLSWKSHTLTLASKIAKHIGVIFRIRNTFSTDILKMLYQTLIEPYLRYCIIIWGNAYDNALKSILTLQKRAIRTVHRAPFIAHSSPLFKKSRVLAFKDLYKKEVCLFTYKSINNYLPKFCNSYMQIKPVHTDYNLRYKPLCLIVPQNRTVLRDKFIDCVAPKIWNEIPYSIKASSSLSIFKHKIYDFLYGTYSDL